MSPVVQTAIVAVIVAAAVAFVIVRTVQSVRGRKPGCCTDTQADGCNSCSGCSGTIGCGNQDKTG